MENAWKALVVGTLTAMAAYLRAVAVPVVVLCAVMMLDWVTGMTAAWINGELDSRVGFFGAIRKLGRLCLVAVGMAADYIIASGVSTAGAELPIDMAVALLVCFWLIINECISVLENCDKAGVPIPEFLKKALKRAHRETEMEEETE